MEPIKWTTPDGKELPLFAFDQPQTITLPNGTVHQFKQWNEQAEKRREDLLKTIIVTSPALINGEQPRDVRTEYTKSTVAYYDQMIDRISGVRFEGFDRDPAEAVPADALLKDFLPATEGADYNGDKVKDLIPIGIKKAAAGRLYGGFIELEKPDGGDDDEFEGDPFDTDDLTRAVEQAKEKREVFTLSATREYVVRQAIGREAIGNSGKFTDETHLMRYHFAEPDGNAYSKWETKARRGWSINLKKGGQKQEMFYNLDVVADLFDQLINRIEGASVGGQEIQIPSRHDEKQRKAVLAAIPLSIKKLTVATLFNELDLMGNF